jgi:hypothetical protein
MANQGGCGGIWRFLIASALEKQHVVLLFLFLDAAKGGRKTGVSRWV